MPFGIDEPALEKLTVSGAGPLVGVAAAAATGGWFGLRELIRRILLTPNVPPMSE